MFSWLKRRRAYGQLVHSMNHHWTDQSYLVLDMETTGLDAAKDRILSLGWVIIEKGGIHLQSAQHMYLKGTEVDTAAIGIHLITDSDLENHGHQAEKVLDTFRSALVGKIVVAHHAPIEIAFLKKIWLGLNMSPADMRILDTLSIERVLLSRKHEGISQNALRLASCRERYGLPDYAAHDALTDALATAELLMAQANHLGGKTSLESLFRMGGKAVTLQGKPESEATSPIAQL